MPGGDTKGNRREKMMNSDDYPNRALLPAQDHALVVTTMRRGLLHELRDEDALDAMGHLQGARRSQYRR